MERRGGGEWSGLAIAIFSVFLVPILGPLWTQLRLSPRVLQLARDGGLRRELAATPLASRTLIASRLGAPAAFALLPWLTGAALGAPVMASVLRHGKEEAIAVAALVLAPQLLSLSWLLLMLALQCRHRASVGTMVLGLVGFLLLEASLGLFIFFVGERIFESMIGGLTAVAATVFVFTACWRAACRAVYDFG
jgi:hypothetical protein